jgi:endoglucanase
MNIITCRSKLLLTVLYLGLLLLLSAAGRATVAHAADSSSGTVSLDQPAYTAHENQGSLQVTIQRTGDLSQAEHVGYGVKRQDAQPGIDFQAIANTYITLTPGQSSYTFQVPIIDQGLTATPVHALAYLYGSWPDSLGANSNSLITILHDDPLQPRDAANPLGVPGPVNGNLLAGTKFYVDPNSPAAVAQRRYAHSKPAQAGLLGDIAGAPGAHRFYMWNMGSNVAGQVAHYLEGTQLNQPGSTVMLSTYTLVHEHCGYTATAAIQARYDNFIQQVAAGIGNTHVVFFLEPDALITTPCLTRGQLLIREAELRYAVLALEADPHVLVYLDGGASDAVHAGRQAQLLRASGVAQAQGFFLNSTHFDWMTSELGYGAQISKRLGGAHFIINSGENGRGPLRPANRVKSGNEVLCNPPGRGLGPLTVNQGIAQPTGYAGADGFLWFTNPGGSGGQCVPGAPPTGTFWPAYAAMLAHNWVDKVSGPSSPAFLAAFGHHQRSTG